MDILDKAQRETITMGYINNIEQVGATNELNEMFLVARQMNAKFGKDGNQWFYIVGNLPEPDCIVGFGNTPENALRDFYKNWHSQ